VAVGGGAGALAAHAGLQLTGQIGTAAAVGTAAVVLWHLRRSRQPAAAPAATNPDVNLDVGGTVQVPAWGDGGHARIAYRGSHWQARHVGAGHPAPGLHVIRAVEGSCLMLERAPH
ncbi:MAG: NfeD family protein, partial [Aquabacterium sp.]|nr:NfeD family protein [Aquabacterium sp.]